MIDEATLGELLSLWERESAAGRDVPASELCRDHPELLAELERRMQAIRQINDLAQATQRTRRETPPAAADSTLVPGDCAVRPGMPAGLPDYEILGVLGRGGMGIVYQARHRQLNRTVALKMILAGAHADVGERTRFLAEAESVARLQHPHIVQLFEFGEHQGLQYFTLEYVPGGSLADKVRQAPLAPRQAAHLVEQLADGMAYAHAQGIVHRDLKPENVLLAADGTPKITDFGLAKRVSSPSLTHSGDVLGTPSYMAPEQARGRSRAIGPATDVYALGAILYRLLTGRPPFQAATVMETLWQVMETEPAAPGQLQAKLARDLETIVLKCLHKEPAKRYASAAALAADLRRFQAGEPIQARRVGALERGWRWCKRNPLVAAVSAASLVVVVASLLGLTYLYLTAEHHRQQAETEREQVEAQRQQAEQQRRRADEERRHAQAYALEVKLQKEEADSQRLAAREEADRSRQVTQFLVGLFEASDPLGLNGFTFGLVSKTGEELTAQELLDRGAKRIASSQNAQPRARADILDAVGNVYRSLGKHAEAEKLLAQALALRKEANAPPSELAASLHALAWLRHEQGQYPTALKLYREALRLRLGDADRDEAAIANSQLNLAWVLTEIEQYEEAEKLFHEVIARRLKRFGREHRETALAKMALAALYLETERYLAAGPLASEVIQVFRKLGEDKNIVDAAVKFQEGVLLSQFPGSNRQAEVKLRESLELARSSLPAKHQYLTLPLVQLAFLLEGGGKVGAAEELYREAFEIVRERVGLAHPKVLVIARRLARLQQRRGQGRLAEEMFEEILAAHKKRFGPEDPFVADVLCEYAEHLYQCKEYSRQEASLQAAAKIYRAAEGPPRRRFCDCLTSLAVSRYRAGRYSESEPLYREALVVARKRYPRPHAMVVAALENVADALIKQEHYNAEVDQLLTEAEGMLPALSPTDRREVRHHVVISRCNYLRAKEGKFAEVAALLGEYRKDMKPVARRYEDVAYQYVQCIPLAGEAETLTEEERAKVCADYGAQAVALLRQAWQKGIANPLRWERAPLLVPIHDRADFQQLLAEIRKK
jgi:tetratricopeptide (TPR) repeat protein